MLEKVTFNKKPMKKAVYKEQWDELLAKLVVLQQQAHNEGVGLVVLFEGWNGAGKGSRISDLMYHLDARSTGVYVGLDLDPDTEREFVGRECGVTGFYPIMQPFWKALGERNSITFYDRGWYTAVIQHMLYNAPAKLLLPKKEERHYLDSVHDFEQQLVADGYVVVKFFVHMTKKAQVERLQRLHDDPVTRWRVTEKKLESHHGYETAYELYDRLLERSDYDFAPWVLLNGEDKRRTNLTIASTLVDALERALARKEADDVLKASLAAREKADALLAEERAVEEAAAAEAAGAVPAPATQPGRGMLTGVALARAEAQAAAAHDLAPKKSRFDIVKHYPQVDTIDHSLVLTLEEYKTERKRLQDRLFRLENIMFQRRVPLILMYEGWDAAGKGGNIKRVAQALDARAYTIFPVAGAHQARARPSVPLALLDAPAQGGARGHVRSQLVRARAGGARGEFRHAGRVVAGLRRNQRVRARSGRLGRHLAEVLGRCEPRGAAAPLPGPRGRPGQAVEDHRGRLAQSREVPPVQGRHRRYVPLDVDHVRSLGGAGVR